MEKSDPSPPSSIVNLTRKLAAILSADVQGYSRLMGDNEVATITTLTAYRAVMTALIQQHHGRVIDSPGDNLLAEFASAVEAVQAAVAIQHELRARNTELPDHRQMRYRIGLNVGDVMEDGQRLYGDGVNIAARIESLAEGGGISLSGSLYEQVKNKLTLTYADQGTHQVKNIAEPVRVYRLIMDEAAAALAEQASQHPLIDAPPSERIPHAAESFRRRVRSVVFVLGCVLLAAGVVLAVRYFPALLLSPQSSSLMTQEAPALPLPDKPSIAVLPFTNMSGDPQQEYFSDGLTEDLITDLSKISGLFVIARNSTFTYKGQAVKVQEVDRDLGVRYVLEGSSRKVVDQVRVTAQLVEAATGYHVWAERYDRPLTDIFAVQDAIVEQIGSALRVEVLEAELARVRRIPTENLTAYDYFLRGVVSGRRAWSEANNEANAQTRQMFEKAVELDPKYAGAYAGLGFTYFLDWMYQRNKDRVQSLEQAFELARQAIALDDSLSSPHRLLSQAYLWKKQYDQAIAEAERAIALDPNNPDGYWNLGVILTQAGRPEEGIGLIKKAMRLNPHYPPAVLNNLGFAYNVAGRCEEAITPLKKALTLNPNLFYSHLNLAGCYAELGRLEEARVEATEVLQLNPHLSLEWIKQHVPSKDPADLERYVAALRKAGLK